MIIIQLSVFVISILQSIHGERMNDKRMNKSDQKLPLEGGRSARKTVQWKAFPLRGRWRVAPDEVFLSAKAGLSSRAERSGVEGPDGGPRGTKMESVTKFIRAARMR